MVGQGFRSYVESCGFAPEDVPKVVGAFVSVKYSTWAASVILAVRCQPLRRLLLTRSQALEVGGAGGGWAALPQRRWVLEALERASRHHPGSIRRFSARAAPFAPVPAPAPAAAARAASSAAAASAAATAAAQPRLLRAQLGEAFAAARSQARAKYRDVKGAWGTAGRKLLSRQQLRLMRLREQLQQRALPNRDGGQTWHAWASARYWKLSDSLEQATRSSRFCAALSSVFRIDAKGLAMGLAEGTILYKSTVWLHVPLQLWLVIHFFRRRRHALLMDDACGDLPAPQWPAQRPPVDT